MTMKMIQAIVRPEKEAELISALEKAGFYSFTRQAVFGRGRQRGLHVGPVHYEELPKVRLMIVVREDEVERAVDTIKIAGRTGNPGDGKLFVSSLADLRPIRKKAPEAVQSYPSPSPDAG